MRARADNPIVQTSFTADPAPVVYNGRLYLYTSHDEDVTVNNFFTMNDWRLYSTVDMVKVSAEFGFRELAAFDLWSRRTRISTSRGRSRGRMISSFAEVPQLTGTSSRPVSSNDSGAAVLG